MVAHTILADIKLETFNVASVTEECVRHTNHIEQVTKDLAALVSLNGKHDGKTACNALTCFQQLAAKCMEHAQPYLCKHLPEILAAAGQKNASKDTRAAAELAIKTITEKASPNTLREVLPYLVQGADQHVSKWQTRVAALQAIAGFADSAPEQLGFALPEILPEISKSVTDIKKEVAEAAEKAMIAACDVIGNRDIEHMTVPIVRSVTHPEDVPEIMHKLAGVTFVQSVQSPALAMVTPLLVRGLQSGVTGIRPSWV